MVGFVAAFKVLTTLTLLIPVIAWADVVHYAIHEIDTNAAAVTLDLNEKKLQPVVSLDGRSVFLTVSQSVFKGEWSGRAGLIKSVDQYRNGDYDVLKIDFDTPVKLRGEEGQRSQRLIAEREDQDDTATRAAFPIRIARFGMVPKSNDLAGITIVLPEGNYLGASPLSMQLRAVALVMDVATQGFLTPETFVSKRTESDVYRGLVQQMNDEVIELRNENMVLEEELRALRAGKKDGEYVGK